MNYPRIHVGRCPPRGLLLKGWTVEPGALQLRPGVWRYRLLPPDTKPAPESKPSPPPQPVSPSPF